jgi:hypothetical protein
MARELPVYERVPRLRLPLVGLHQLDLPVHKHGGWAERALGRECVRVVLFERAQPRGVDGHVWNGISFARARRLALVCFFSIGSRGGRFPLVIPLAARLFLYPPLPFL